MSGKSSVITVSSNEGIFLPHKTKIFIGAFIKIGVLDLWCDPSIGPRVTVLPTGWPLLRQARTWVNGYLNYYAITDNSDRCSYYVYCVERILFKWLNRKS
ncbi:MAG: hypothetical protein KAS19_06785, partial [Anaerolineales bacterium]|nr:hypothetical protein [Anaerolineales bacterium]